MLGINYSICVHVDDTLSTKKRNVVSTIINELLEENKTYVISSKMINTLLNHYTQGNEFPTDSIPISSIIVNLDRFFNNKPIILYAHASLFLQQQFYFYLHFPVQTIDKYIIFGKYVTLFETAQELHEKYDSKEKAFFIGKLGRNFIATVDNSNPFSYTIHNSFYERNQLKFDKKPEHRYFYDLILEREVSDEPNLLASHY